MPIFELYCLKCNEPRGERMLRGGAVAHCEKCEGELSKVPARSNFVLKGSSWAKDGYQ